MGRPASVIEVRDVELAVTLDLRSRVLRSHMPGTPATAPSDLRADTWHLAAYCDGRLVGVVSGFPEAAPGRPGVPAQRFRWMAVEPADQGGGVGRVLMDEIVSRAVACGDRLLWANGRDTALDFYRRYGFTVVGDSFIDSVSGLPHTVVLLEVSASPSTSPTLASG